MNKFIIENNFQAPKYDKNGVYETVLKMKMGDSIFVENDIIVKSFHYYAKKINRKITQRKEKNGYRIWLLF